MKTSEIINNICSELGISKADLAKKMGIYPSSLYRKLATESMTFEELQKCLDILGVRVELECTYPDGERLSSLANHEQLIERMHIMERELETVSRTADFRKKAFRDLRTELNNAFGYTELGIQHGEKAEMYLQKLQTVHNNMERTISYALGEVYEEEKMQIEPSAVKALVGNRVLLVEDNELNRLILKEILVGHGLLVEEADEGGKAIEKIKNNTPGHYQFVVMDLEMPEMDGYETTLRIRKLPNRIRANVPIIALTANALPENREKAIVVGMDDFLTKPINSERLLYSLTKYL